MKKQRYFLSGKLISLVLIALLLSALVIVGASAADSGTCGDGLTWTLDDNGLLTISGSGIMTSSPWRNAGEYDEDWNWHSTAVKTVVINNGVKNIP